MQQGFFWDKFLFKSFYSEQNISTWRGLKLAKIIVDSKCTGCETCVNICPASVYEMINGKSVPVRAKDCILCRTCEAQCPEGAIQVFEEEEQTKAEPKIEEKEKKKEKPAKTTKPQKTKKPKKKATQKPKTKAK